MLTMMSLIAIRFAATRHPELPEYSIYKTDSQHCVACTKLITYWMPLPVVPAALVVDPNKAVSLPSHVRSEKGTCLCVCVCVCVCVCLCMCVYVFCDMQVN